VESKVSARGTAYYFALIAGTITEKGTVTPDELASLRLT